MFLSGFTNMKYHLGRKSHTQDILLITDLKKMSHLEQESLLVVTYWTSLEIPQLILHQWRQLNATDNLFYQHLGPDIALEIYPTCTFALCFLIHNM